MRGSDSELFRDKIEVSLDGRQIFYLFFGGAVIASMVFVLGVMVGRRVEARSFAGSAPISAAHDPLAALDKLDTKGPTAPELAFPVALRSDVASTPPIGEIDDSLAKARAVPVDAEDEEAQAAQAAAEQAAVAGANHEDVERKATAAQLASEKKALKSAEKMLAKASKLRDKLIRAEKKRAAAEAKAQRKAAAEADAAALAAARQGDDSKAADGEQQPVAEPKSRRAKFCLQLSSFQDRAEADAFFTEIRNAGYQPFIVEAEVPDKGLWYRVRLGKYETYEDAVAAKEDFEKSQKIIAYVTRIKR
jgi:cell division septation protein DedD